MTTDFFDREAHAQKQTRRLVWLFALIVLAVLIANNLVLDTIIWVFSHPQDTGAGTFPFNFLSSALYIFFEGLMVPSHFVKLVFLHHPGVIACVSLGTLVSIAGGCWYKLRELSEGGSVIAELLGGRRLVPGSTDLDEQRLRNVVEEMAIASSTPVPDIYIMDDERGINSFAAGHTRNDVAIGVTRGTLKLLTRDELQGVIAHEFSHVLNGDTRLNMQLIALAHGLFWPTLLGRVLTWGTSEEPALDSSLFSEDDKVNMLPTAPIGFVFLFIGSANLPFVRLLKSAICRQREWLADAAAVQFTRHPEGIVGALKKIGGLFKQGRLDAPNAEMASHLYFADSNYTPWFKFLATHPPLTDRVKAIDPMFGGIFAKVTMLPPNQMERDRAFDEMIGVALPKRDSQPMDPLGYSASITSVRLNQIKTARLNLPPAVKTALNSPAGAAAIVFSLLLSEDESVRARQLEILRTNLAPDTFAQTAALAPQIAQLNDRYRFVLADSTVPALREYNTDEHDAFHQTIQQIVEADGSIDLFAYMLMKMVARQLRVYRHGPQSVTFQYGRVSDFLPECTLLLSALAYLGQDDETSARTAFKRGAEYLDAPNADIKFLTRNEWDLSKVDAALTRLAGHHDPLKRNILIACSRTVVAGDNVSERDAELLRAIADTLDCPLPPFVESALMAELSKEQPA